MEEEKGAVGGRLSSIHTVGIVSAPGRATAGAGAGAGHQSQTSYHPGNNIKYLAETLPKREQAGECKDL